MVGSENVQYKIHNYNILTTLDVILMKNDCEYIFMLQINAVITPPLRISQVSESSCLLFYYENCLMIIIARMYTFLYTCELKIRLKNVFRR